MNETAHYARITELRNEYISLGQEQPSADTLTNLLGEIRMAATPDNATASLLRAHVCIDAAQAIGPSPEAAELVSEAHVQVKKMDLPLTALYKPDHFRGILLKAEISRHFAVLDHQEVPGVGTEGRVANVLRQAITSKGFWLSMGEGEGGPELMHGHHTMITRQILAQYNLRQPSLVSQCWSPLLRQEHGPAGWSLAVSGNGFDYVKMSLKTQEERQEKQSVADAMAKERHVMPIDMHRDFGMPATRDVAARIRIASILYSVCKDGGGRFDDKALYNTAVKYLDRYAKNILAHAGILQES
jgi:hypothetical protein